MSIRFVIIITVMVSCFSLWGCKETPLTWSPQEVDLINSLSLYQQQNISKDIAIQHQGNEVWEQSNAVTLGHKLFFDTRLSGNGKVACANCHQPKKAFTDGLTYSIGMGITSRHTPTIIGIANSPWLFWDGRADSLWAQALGPLENPSEHGANRLQLVHLINDHYISEYEAVFGKLTDFSDQDRFPAHAMPQPASTITSPSPAPTSQQQVLQTQWNSMTPTDQARVNLVFNNIGKSLAAYENLIMPGPARFDDFAAKLKSGLPSTDLSLQEQAGLKLFINEDKAQCIRCHNGPLLTNHEFSATGISDTRFSNAQFLGTALNQGRFDGVEKAFNDPFNCFNTRKNESEQCVNLAFTKRHSEDLKNAYKVPSLRNVSLTSPYMHNGSLDTLKDVLNYYNQAQSQINPIANTINSPTHIDIAPLRLLPHEVNQITSFLHTLTSPLNVDQKWLASPFKKAL